MTNIIDGRGMKNSLFRSTEANLVSENGQQAKITSDMRSVFQESYGLEMKFPGYYYKSSRFVPHESKEKYIIVLAWHIIPTGID